MADDEIVGTKISCRGAVSVVVFPAQAEAFLISKGFRWSEATAWGDFLTAVLDKTQVHLENDVFNVVLVMAEDAPLMQELGIQRVFNDGR